MPKRHQRCPFEKFFNCLWVRVLADTGSVLGMDRVSAAGSSVTLSNLGKVTPDHIALSMMHSLKSHPNNVFALFSDLRNYAQLNLVYTTF